MEIDIPTQNQTNKIPSMSTIQTERVRLAGRERRRRACKKMIFVLLVVASIAVIISFVFFSVLKVTGTSMEPTLHEGEIILAQKTSIFETGDICSFQYNNQQVIKRVIAGAGDWVDIDENGNVSVNGERIEEPYVQKQSLGFNDLNYPYQVPEGTVFVMGDHRTTSIDSRSAEMGPVSINDIAGKVIWRIVPFGPVLKTEQNLLE